MLVRSACCAALLPWPWWVWRGRRTISGALPALFMVAHAPEHKWGGTWGQVLGRVVQGSEGWVRGGVGGGGGGGGGGGWGYCFLGGR